LLTGVGLALLGLTLYMSTLGYSLRQYSRVRLSEHLKGNRRSWLDWLDAHERELVSLTGFARLALALGFIVCLALWSLRSEAGLERPWPLIRGGVIALALLSIFAVGLPGSLASYFSEPVLAQNLRLLRALRVILWPVGRTLAGIDFVVRRLAGKADTSHAEPTALAEQEILEAVSEGAAAGAVDPEQKEIIQSVFELDDTAVSAIMTPRTDINAVPVTASYEEVRDTILRSGHSRIPVYEQSIDHIIGVVYAKDLLRLQPGEPFDARRIMRTAPYVPETKSVRELLNEFRRTKVQIAIVLDEYGGTAGLATIEDILEELVGEIDDEYDQQAAPATRQIDADTLEVDARVRVDEVNAKLGIRLPENGDYDTIGGFVFARLGRIPTVGEEFSHENVHFRILAAEPRKINRLRIHVERPTGAGAS
jgi:putative hemolysin